MFMHVTNKQFQAELTIYFPSAETSDPAGHKWSYNPTLVKVKYLFF
jgi:hypothetical protein